MIDQLPRKTAMLALVASAALLAIAIGTNVAGTKSVDFSQPRTPVVRRALIFKDAPSGGIAVFDQGASKPFDVLEREKNTFMATALRLLAVERARRSSAGADSPFMLTQWNDGGLSLDDPATGESLELAAFGHTNAGTFARLLPVKGKTQ